MYDRCVKAAVLSIVVLTAQAHKARAVKTALLLRDLYMHYC
jgi:hypothetical protein